MQTYTKSCLTLMQAPPFPCLPSPEGFHSMRFRLAPRPYTHKLIGMLGTIILYMLIVFGGYASVGVTGAQRVAGLVEWHLSPLACRLGQDAAHPTHMRCAPTRSPFPQATWHTPQQCPQT